MEKPLKTVFLCLTALLAILPLAHAENTTKQISIDTDTFLVLSNYFNLTNNSALDCHEYDFVKRKDYIPIPVSSVSSEMATSIDSWSEVLKIRRTSCEPPFTYEVYGIKTWALIVALCIIGILWIIWRINK